MRVQKDTRRSPGRACPTPTAGREASLFLVFAAACLALAAPTAMAVPAQASAAEGAYVALGDSYTAVGTLTERVPGTPSACNQDTDNYPHVVARSLGLQLADVSCSGAEVGDLAAAQSADSPPQFDALTPSTAVVTLGIGGNDNNTFSTAVRGCEAIDALHVFDIGSPCADYYKSTFTDAIAADEVNIAGAVQRIHRLAPQAKVFVVGYPDILPRSGNCRPRLTLTTKDTAYLDNVERALNSMLRRVAEGNGATYVDTYTPSIGHDACQSAATRWVEPLVPAGSFAPFHPNAVGQQRTAAAVEAALRDAGIG
ncbi:SGNH/GDSL hydrolase family protein [Kitasatospora purpeofusca]|uniref:SGNH/GDSL hydrolase family protein n=1 Tax=Kitasatospora purpeofusca TaxID=67352 RepID=UPI0036D35327